MHIVQLANFYGPATGGLRTALDQLARHYLAEGHQVSTVVPSHRTSIEQHGDRVLVRLKAPLVPRMGGYRMIVDREAVANALELLGPDVLELSDKTSLARCVLQDPLPGVPTVLISHERLDAVLSSVGMRGRWSRYAISRCNSWLAARVDAVVCASDYAAAEWSTVGGVRMVRIPLGVDLKTFQPADTCNEGPARLVSLVRLSHEKRPAIVVETSRELQRRGVDHRFEVIGSGPLADTLRRSAHGLPIRFLGHIGNRAAVARRIASARVGVAPGPIETFGLAALELMASGTPVVVPDHGALREIVAQDTGYVAQLDPGSFADGVERLLAGDAGQQQLACRSHAEAFTWSRTALRFLDLYDGLVGTSVRPERDLVSAW